MLNIKFTRKCKQATVLDVEIDTGADCDRPIVLLTWNCEQQYIAAILQKYLNEQVCKSIRNAHQLGYEQGYRDGRGKKKRKTLFAATFRTGPVAW